MKVTDKEVSYVAGLANLQLTNDDRAGMVRDLNAILGYIDRLNELDTQNVTQTLGVESGNFSESWRDDVREGLRKSLPHDEAMQNAPQTDGTFFDVPKVIEK
jgi:aspartyl-tRNA(Asn)/glutamyl-tRNA(Gln) amidotransferase subunit C